MQIFQGKMMVAFLHFGFTNGTLVANSFKDNNSDTFKVDRINT